MANLFYIAIGGSFGAVARYLVSRWVHQFLSSAFPWGTLIINCSGSFLIGFLFFLFQETLVPTGLRNLILVGFLGAYTTFSTYSLETINLLKEGEFKFALLNVLFSNMLGLILVVLGIYCARLMLNQG